MHAYVKYNRHAYHNFTAGFNEINPVYPSIPLTIIGPETCLKPEA